MYMDKISKTLKNIGKLNDGSMEKAAEYLDNLTKPQGSLGVLEDIAKKIAGITGNERPSLKNKVIFTFAADHGVTDEGVSAFPKDVTAQMVYNFMRGGAAINVIARHVGAKVIVADLGVASDLKNDGKLIIKKISYGTKNMGKGQAMTRDEALRSIEAGIEIFEDELKNGIDVVGTGDMGIGNTTASTAIAAVFTGEAVEKIAGRGTGVDDAAFKKKIDVIKQAIKLNKPDPKDAIDVLAKVGGFEIGGLAGIIIAASANKTPVVIDGFISGAAALVAYHIDPLVKDYIFASHCSAERGHKIMLDHIGLKPMFDLNMRLGEGTGAALGIGLLDVSLKILNEMATFKSAGVSEKGT
jgi:nicotinate-nucleotide--dimethylbenzimidazole phosphoribosyltransferase